MAVVRARGFAAFVVAGGVTLGTFALAQPRKPKPLPPASKADASAPEAPSAPADTKEEPSAPSPPPEVMDGGLKPSPLNPTAPEMPSGSTATGDAGTPVDYERLLADIAALRARVATLSDNLYQSRITINAQIEGDHARLARFTVSLDDGVVFSPKESFAASDMTQVYNHAVAPGRHAITVDADRADDRDPSFRTSQRSRFTVDVPRDHQLEVQIRVIDDSGMGGDFPADKSGKYDLRFRVKAIARPAGK